MTASTSCSVAQVADLRAETARLRSDLATVLELVLVNVANVPDDKVRQFVSSRLRRGEPC